MTERIPIPGSTFAGHPDGLALQLYFEAESGHVVALPTLQKRFEGPPEHLHGGASAALLDEVMGVAVWRAGYRVVAVHLDFDYRLPVPLETPLEIRGWVERAEGRKVFTLGQIIVPEGKIAVEGRGVFVEAPHLFSQTPPFSATPYG